MPNTRPTRPVLDLLRAVVTVLAALALLIPAMPTAHADGDGEIFGIVTDAGSGEPIAGALVEVAVVGDHESELYDTTTTDEDGSYRLGDLPMGVYAWVVIVEGYHPSRSSAGLFGDDRSAERDVALDVDVTGGRLGQVVGTVRDDAGQVLDGVAINFHSVAVNRYARTDGDGSYSIPLGVGDHRVQVEHRDFRDFEGNVTVDADGTQTFDIDLVPVPDPVTFPDVGSDHPFVHAIGWLAAYGYADGFDDGTFRPGGTVTRQAMAAFLHRMEGEPEVAGVATFTDVGADHPFHDAIAWMAAEGLAGGYADGTFRPSAPMARQAAAAFLHRFDGSPEVSVGTDFPDVPSGHPFEDEITWMRNRGHAHGFDDCTFRPDAPVTRQAAAAFLHRFDCWPCIS